MCKKISIELRDWNVAHISGDYAVSTIDDATSFRVNGFQFSYKYKKGWWDGKTHLYSKNDQTFPAGLVGVVQRALRTWADKRGHTLEITVVDNRNIKDPINNGLSLYGVTLRDYQLAGAKAMVAKQRGILKIATNGGKTITFIAVAKHLGLQTLMLVPGKELLHQVYAEFKRFLPPSEVGIIGDGKWKPKKYTVAIPNTLASRIKKKKPEAIEYLKGVDVICSDECHKVGASQFYNVLKACPAHYRYGLSGTPLDRTDGADLKLIAQTGEVVYEVSNKQLIDAGLSTDVEILFVTISGPDDISHIREWSDVYELGIVKNDERNREIAKYASQMCSEGRGTLIIVNLIDHGELLNELIPKSQFMHGGLASAERQKMLKSFKSGNIDVLIATNILDEGVSIDNIDAIIMGAGGKSRIRTLQRLGRGLRTGGNSDTLRIVDFIDSAHSMIAKHSMKRFKDYQAEDCFRMTLVDA